MVLCKYFMQGCCRYGNGCNFEHPRGGNAGYAYSAQRQLFGGGGGGGSNFGGGGNQYKWVSNDYQKQSTKPATQGTLSPTDIINTLIAEVKDWEHNKMWPFSCIAFEKEAPCVPDFEDTSPEELRHLAYEAQKSNKTNEYVDHVQNLAADFSKKRQMVANPKMTVKQKLMSLIDDYRLKKNRSSQSATSYTAVSLFTSLNNSASSSSSASVDTTSFSTDSVDGDEASFVSKPFASTSGAFGSTPGIFGSTTGSTTAGFGSAMTNAFGSNQTGIFNSTSTFVSPVSTNTSNPFGSPTLTPSAFGNSSSANVFGAGQNSNSSVGFQDHTLTAFGSRQTSFSSANSSQVSQASGAIGGSFQTGDQNSSVYTPIDQLTAEELAEFQATHFTLGKIPTKPPPKELCF